MWVSGSRACVAYTHRSAGRAPAFVAEYEARPAGGRPGVAAVVLRKLRALQPAWLLVQLREEEARFRYSGWPELGMAAEV